MLLLRRTHRHQKKVRVFEIWDSDDNKTDPLRRAVAFDESVVFVKSPVCWVDLIATCHFADAIGVVARGFEDFGQCHAVVGLADLNRPAPIRRFGLFP